MAEKSDRRAFLNKTLLGAAGLGAAYSLEEKILLNALEGQTQAAETSPAKAAAAGSLPHGKIGNVSISRLFLGGNLIGGWAHSRDLMYVSQLFKAYNTDAKVFETLALAEQHGINTVLIDPVSQNVVEKYKRERGGKIQTMVCMHPDADEGQMDREIKDLVDKGATLVYTHGELTDGHTRAERVHVLARCMELIKKHGVPAGIGSHSLETPMACQQQGVHADFYVKTLHMDRYWSATPKDKREEWCWYKPQTTDHDGYHDNMWCLDAEKTIAFMETVKKPWVAFKVMAAGAIPPRMAFPYAYRHGADFVVAGMFDFHIEEDVKLAAEALRKVDQRKRDWC
jgi:hypothetical protein